MSLYRTDNNGNLIKVAGNITTDNITILEQLIADSIKNKVDKIEGKGLSTNDYTTAEKTKLAGIAEGANKITVDSALSTTSTNPLRNSVIASNINSINSSITALQNADTTNKNTLQTNINTVSTNLSNLTNTVTALQTTVNGLITKIFPVNSIYITTTNTNPKNILGIGTWEAVTGGYALWTTTSAPTSESEGKDSGSTIYRKIPAGLPNITGSKFLAWNDASGGGVIMNAENSNSHGALFSSRRTGKAFYTSGSSHSAHSDLEFDASRSNSIYGNSTTVQPKAYRVFVWKRTA